MKSAIQYKYQYKAAKSFMRINDFRECIDDFINYYKKHHSRIKPISIQDLEDVNGVLQEKDYCKLCDNIFIKTKNNQRCPCTLYKKSYVKKKVKEHIEAYEKENNINE